MALGKAGEIALFRFPQTDLNLGSLRPSLLVAQIPNAYDDWLVCMISSQLHQAIPNFDEIILRTDTDFAQTRLKSDSVIRLSRLAVVSETIFVGKLGEISPARLQRVKDNLADWIRN
jgi:mRNA interferase MazF